MGALSTAMLVLISLITLVRRADPPRAQIAAADTVQPAPLCVAHCEAPTHAEDSQPVCGNGIIEAGEECDDGNTRSLDGCDPTCRLEHASRCGDGIVDSDEECDEGDDIDGDGCSKRCKIDPL